MRKLSAILLASTLFIAPAQAVLVQLGQRIYFPGLPVIGPAIWANTGGVGQSLNSANAQDVMVGYITGGDPNFQNGAAKQIQSISYAVATGTCAACNSQVVVTIEGVGNGPPAPPNGTLIAAGASVTQNFSATPLGGGINTTPNFVTPPTVHNGDKVAVRFAPANFDTGQIRFAGVGTLYDCGAGNQFNQSTDGGATWTQGACSNASFIQFNFTDGTKGTLAGGFMYDAWNSPNTDTYNSSSGFDSVSIGVKFNISGSVDCLGAGVGIASTSSTFTMRFTDSAATPNILGSVVVDPHFGRGTGNGGFNLAGQCWGMAPVNVTAGTLYHVEVVATGSGNISVNNIQVGAASAFDNSFNAGQAWDYFTRKTPGSYTETPTKRPNIWVGMSAVEIGSTP